MKIGILTLPLRDNYGGLLQAYALSEVLTNLGHEVQIINRRANKTTGLRKIASKVKGKILGRTQITQNQKNIISKETNSFREKYIPNLTNAIESEQEMLKLNNSDFDAYVVGSDQCWRPKHSPNIRNYFLDFLK